MPLVNNNVCSGGLKKKEKVKERLLSFVLLFLKYWCSLARGNVQFQNIFILKVYHDSYKGTCIIYFPAKGKVECEDIFYVFYSLCIAMMPSP